MSDILREAWLVNAPDVHDADIGWEVCELQSDGGGTVLANWLSVPGGKGPYHGPNQARRVGTVRVGIGGQSLCGRKILTDAEFLALWDAAAPAAATAAPCRSCGGTGLVDMSFGRRRLVPCLDCPAGAAHPRGA